MVRGTEAEADGDVGVPGVILFPLYRSLSLARVLSGVGREGENEERERGKRKMEAGAWTPNG